ncbi:hypothetical protein PPERSA_08215 [Pseudocohnilembus persalinus]|uniref:Uncharacterized protein n=1 Tax=Pseudocohnilembus persalinus TaxID=266149 RepID=A0A0V0QG45_PSEPJ|nr:hypothetical protein PPERSA_08215 [Pseudocohnilembus persalinus]|eukprot:KRX01114.1 hypothetical protein PPERSA_08215 [Pseudocohnilembus persalinus]
MKPNLDKRKNKIINILQKNQMNKTQIENKQKFSKINNISQKINKNHSFYLPQEQEAEIFQENIQENCNSVQKQKHVNISKILKLNNQDKSPLNLIKIKI